MTLLVRSLGDSVNAPLPHRLGRHIEQDDRSRGFAMSPRPRGVDRRWGFSKPVLDQGPLSSCIGEAIAQCFNTDFFEPYRRARGVDWLTQSDAQDIYHFATVADSYNDPGVVWPPHDNGSTALGGAKAAMVMGMISSYHHTFDFTSFCAAVELQPVCVGTTWYDSMFHPDPATRHRVVVDTSAPRGGHEYVCLGISYTQRSLRFLTSWGEDFGDRGQFEVDFEDFEGLLNNDGDVLVLHATGMTPPDAHS